MRKNWRPLNDAARARVHPRVNPDHIYALDVKALGLEHVDTFSPSGLFSDDWHIIDLFADDRRQPISQWPNPTENIRGINDPGWTTCNGSRDEKTFFYGGGGQPEDGDGTNEVDLDGTRRAERWARSLASGHEVWLKGFWRTPWSPWTAKVRGNRHLGAVDPPGGAASWRHGFEIHPGRRPGSLVAGRQRQGEVDRDQPARRDRPTRRVGAGYQGPKTLLPSTETPAPAQGHDRRHEVPGRHDDTGSRTSTWSGFAWKAGSAMASRWSTAPTSSSPGARWPMSGIPASAISAGTRNVIRGNDIYETGGWGIELRQLGDRKTLRSCDSAVANNHVHHIGRVSFKEAIRMDHCVGVTIAHNLIHDTPKGGIRHDLINNCLFEYNEIHNVALKESDTGTIYGYGGWTHLRECLPLQFHPSLEPFERFLL